jgi:SAM-dependent methyltransferase
MSLPAYPIAVGKADADRLALLNRLYNPNSCAFIQRTGLSSGMQVLEVGCGTGETACWLARQVGPAGQVVAIDQSEQQLALARAKAHQLKLTNLRFQCLSLLDIHELNCQFDLIYGRWVLVYLTNALAGLAAIYNLLKPQGILICEEYSLSALGLFAEPPCQLTDVWQQQWRHNAEKSGLSVNIGTQLWQGFTQLGLSAMTISSYQPVLTTSQQKRLLRLSLMAWRQSFFKNNMLDKQSYNFFYSKLIEFEQQPGILAFIRNILVSGRRAK